MLKGRALPRIDRAALVSLLCYALAIGLASGSNFLSVPLILSLVGPADFARWALIEPLILALIPLAGFGINYGLMHAIAHSDRPRRAIGMLLPAYAGASLLVAMVGGGIALASWGMVTAALCAAIILVEGMVALFVTYWRARERPGFFAAVEGGRAAAIVVVLAIAWLAVPSLIRSIPAYMAVRAGIGMAAIVLAILIIRPIGPGDRSETAAAIRFGLPIVCASVLVSLTMTVDRYAVAHFVAMGAVPLYVAQVKLVQVLGSALAPFFTWFAPVAIRRLPEGEAAHPFFANSVFLFHAVNCCCTIGMWFLTPLVWHPLFGSLPFDPMLFAILLLGQMIYALGNPVSIGTLRPGKTWQALRATTVTIALTVAGCAALGAVAGAQGVAWGRFIGASAYTLVLAAGTVRDLRIRFPWGRMLLLSLVPCAAIIGTMETVMGWPLWLDLIAAFAGCVLVLALAFRFRLDPL